MGIVPGQAGGWSFKIETLIIDSRAVPIGCGQACRTSQQQSLGFSFRRHLFSRLDLFSSHLISSHRSFSLKVLIASHCHHSLCHRISSRFISCRVSFSIRRISSHLISSHHISSYLIISHHISSHLISSHLRSSLLISALLGWSQLSDVIWAFLISSQLIWILLFSALLSFSILLLSSSPLFSCQAVSTHPISPYGGEFLQRCCAGCGAGYCPECGDEGPQCGGEVWQRCCAGCCPQCEAIALQRIMLGTKLDCALCIFFEASTIEMLPCDGDEISSGQKSICSCVGLMFYGFGCNILGVWTAVT